MTGKNKSRLKNKPPKSDGEIKGRKLLKRVDDLEDWELSFIKRNPLMPSNAMGLYLGLICHNVVQLRRSLGVPYMGDNIIYRTVFSFDEMSKYLDVPRKKVRRFLAENNIEPDGYIRVNRVNVPYWSETTAQVVYAWWSEQNDAPDIRERCPFCKNINRESDDSKSNPLTASRTNTDKYSRYCSVHMFTMAQRGLYGKYKIKESFPAALTNEEMDPYLIMISKAFFKRADKMGLTSIEIGRLSGVDTLSVDRFRSNTLGADYDKICRMLPVANMSLRAVFEIYEQTWKKDGPISPGETCEVDQK